jgi:hypothetical protein
MKYITTRDIVIPAGTELSMPPLHSTRWAKDHDAVIALGNDHCGYFSVDPQEGVDSGWLEPKP